MTTPRNRQASQDPPTIRPAEFRRPGDGVETAPPEDAIRPSDFASLRARSQSTDLQGRKTVPAGLFWAAAAVLLLTAVTVFVYLPRMVANQGPPDIPAAQSALPAQQPGTSAGSGAAPASSELAPWQTAQLLRLKEEAEALTENFVRLQMELEQQRVDLWGAEEFSRATGLAQSGDGAFSQRDYRSASTQYQQGIELLTGLQDQAGQVLGDALDRGRQALAAYDAAAATTAFELALAMDPDNALARQGLQRAGTLQQVASLAAEAVQDEQRGDLAGARDRLQQARGLDPLDAQVASALARVQALQGDQRYSESMSRGYAELAAGNFDAAKAAFAQAGRLRPDSKEIDEALAQVELQRKLERITGLQRQAREHEAAERWTAAAATYESALELDATLVFAREGLLRCNERAELDTRLRNLIQQPERLQADSVHQAAGQILQVARNIEPQTPLLTQQLQELERLLALSRQPVPVTFQSDNLTVVTLQKVGRLGAFQEKQLQLRPGDYVVVGQRRGYRDVRKPFRVQPGEAGLAVQVICEEAI